MIVSKRYLLCAALLTGMVVLAQQAASAKGTPPALEISFRGENGLIIPAVFYSAPQKPAPTVLLLNFRHRWSDWAPIWAARGLNIVAIDELIYNVGGNLDALNKQDITNIRLVLQQLDDNPAVIPHQFAVVGGSLMGGYALQGCALSADCRTAILLSPTDTAVDVPHVFADLGQRPVLIVASKGEVGIADTARDFDNRAQGDHRLIMYDWGYHATAMFYAHPELVDIVGDWFVKYLAEPAQATQAAG